VRVKGITDFNDGMTQVCERSRQCLERTKKSCSLKVQKTINLRLACNQDFLFHSSQILFELLGELLFKKVMGECIVNGQ
jgi:hypothetical protein